MITAKIETISPEIAKKMLANNYSRNRNLRPARVRQYKEDMEKGKFGICTDAIGIDENGELINGQHRLNAVVAYGKPVDFLVVRGLPKESIMYIDGQLTRNASDQLKMTLDDPLYGNKSAAAFVKQLWARKSDGCRSVSISSFKLKDLIDEFYFLCKFQSNRRGKGTINNAIYMLPYSALSGEESLPFSRWTTS